jgi:uncharacterized protein YjeT (DUF2065 family)
MAEITSNVISSMLLILGLSYLLQPGQWVRFAKEAIENPHRSLALVLFLLTLGLATVATHNLWTLDWSVVVTIIGWLMVIKATLFMLVPQFVKPFTGWSDAFMRTYIRVGGIAIVIVAAPLVYRHLVGS